MAYTISHFLSLFSFTSKASTNPLTHKHTRRWWSSPRDGPTFPFSVIKTGPSRLWEKVKSRFTCEGMQEPKLKARRSTLEFQFSFSLRLPERKVNKTSSMYEISKLQLFLFRSSPQDNLLIRPNGTLGLRDAPVENAYLRTRYVTIINLSTFNSLPYYGEGRFENQVSPWHLCRYRRPRYTQTTSVPRR